MRVSIEKKVSFGEEKVEVTLQKEDFVVFVVEFFRGRGGAECAEAHRESGGS